MNQHSNTEPVCESLCPLQGIDMRVNTLKTRLGYQNLNMNELKMQFSQKVAIKKNNIVGITLQMRRLISVLSLCLLYREECVCSKTGNRHQ